MATERDLFEEEQEMVAMSFGDHIEELRLRLVLALLGLGAGVVLSVIPPLSLGYQVMRGMQDPAQEALDAFYARLADERAEAAEQAEAFSQMEIRIPAQDFIGSLRKLAPNLELPPENAPSLAESYIEVPMRMRSAQVIRLVDENVQHRRALIALAPLETAIIFFTVCLITGLVIASPWVFYQIWAFVAAGLYRHERRYVYRFLPFSLGLFLAGVFLCYFVVLPMTLRFLLQFNMWLGVEANFRISEWMGFATVLPLVFGLGFQTPLVMLFLGQLGILSADEFRSKRKFAVLVTVVMAAMLTPGPDVISQLCLAVPMLGLYELGIVLVGRVERQSLLEADA